ncbi:AraC family transcriptional regulator [Teredinibacter sp. KSP-S5-2]|uniref:AraC family transcriptional regulator n=1 Tax=Teredinibacter sp. KSP-S5-2 TaxID=3034506 RepID=UPI002934C525|nr:AraC family transcriptional regulator [Teredinibacter sp. KSP-S5-2]WNO08803.1 AraC family transcriptional regulator [Teredinibacter sp. KSP-S5-2]
MVKKRDYSEQLCPLQQAMSRVISNWVEGPDDWATPVPNLGFFRREELTEPCFCLIEPSVVLVVQGTKQILAGNEVFPYDTSNFLITSLDLPAKSQVLDASPHNPCLGLVLKLDIRILAELIAQSGLLHQREQASGMSIGLGAMTPAIMEPLKRLLDLMDEPEAIDVLSPIIQREIHYRLLLSDQGSLLRHIASVDSQGHRIAKAVDWLKGNFALPLRVQELAARVQMSTPTFHHHFRQLTAMSPLQYQKWLRLNEAKRLMINEHMDASSAAFNVGYESPSQFSREYSRLFGMPPKRDIQEMRRRADGIG